MKKYLLTVCLLIGSLTVQAEEVLDGRCGENALWTLEDSVLTVSGVGPMYDFGSSNQQVYDTIHHPVYIYDTIHHPVDVYNTVYSYVYIYDTLRVEMYDKTVIYDTIYNTYKVQVNDYDTVKIHVMHIIYTDTVYATKYIEQSVAVYDTIVDYIFNWDDPDEVYKVIGKDEIVEIRRIDGSFFGYCTMNRMLRLSPGIYILRSFRTDNRLKIRVK